MKISNNELRKGELPTLVSDLNGKIIYLNNRAVTDLYPVKVGDNVSKFVDLDYVRKFSIFDKKIDVVAPKASKFEKLILRTAGIGATKTIEYYFAHSEKDCFDEMEKDKRFFSTYSEIVNTEANKVVKLNEFITRIVQYMHSDLRFAYRKFDVIKTDDKDEMYTNYAHLSALTVGTIIALNEINYRNPIEISVRKMLDEYSLEISVGANTFKNAEGLSELLELYPRISMRLIYLTSLCDDTGVKYKFVVKPNRICASFMITELVNKTGKFCYAVFGMELQAFVTYVMDIFNSYDANGTSEEEQE